MLEDYERKWMEGRIAEIPELKASIDGVERALNCLNLVSYRADASEGNHLRKSIGLLGGFKALMQAELNEAYRFKEKLNDQPTVGE